MNNNVYAEVSRLPRLALSKEFFADYLTALLSRVRRCPKCEAIFSGKRLHPLIAIQLANQRQLQTLNVAFVPAALLIYNPFLPTEKFIADVNTLSDQDPKLNSGWAAFLTTWEDYKGTQHKIFDIIVNTLRVGSSMHYARAVPYGAGMLLLNRIREDNMQNTTRALFAIISSLFTLKLKTGETFESYRQRFDLINNRFSNWIPPIILPDSILLFFVLRGLPNDPYGPTRHIILAKKTINLVRGLALLRDVGQSEVGMIANTLGSGAGMGDTQNTNAILAIEPPPASRTAISAAKAAAKEKKRQAKMTDLCRQLGPCANHGPHSLHATCECKGTGLSKNKKNKVATPVNTVTPQIPNPINSSTQTIPQLPPSPYMQQ